MPLKNYILLGKSIKNWPLYFKKKSRDAIYITRGAELEMEVPHSFFYVFKEIFMEDFYSINKLLKHIPAQPIIIDIGGNAGYFSFLIASKRKQAKVFAYEPIPENIDVFRSNITRNKGLEKRIQLYQQAVTGVEQPSVTLFFDDVHHNTVIASVYQEFSADNKKAIQIDAISLAKIIAQKNLAVVDLLKLDCEGSEYPILYDSPAHIWTLIKCIAIEVHELDNDKRNCRYLSSFLRNKGFKMIIRPDANGCYYLLAYKK